MSAQGFKAWKEAMEAHNAKRHLKAIDEAAQALFNQAAKPNCILIPPDRVAEAIQAGFQVQLMDKDDVPLPTLDGKGKVWIGFEV